MIDAGRKIKDSPSSGDCGYGCRKRNSLAAGSADGFPVQPGGRGLRGIGDAGAPMFYLLFAQVFCRQIYLFVISRLVPGSVAVIGMAFPMGWMLCAAMMPVHYIRLNWEKRIEA